MITNDEDQADKGRSEPGCQTYNLALTASNGPTAMLMAQGIIRLRALPIREPENAASNP